MGAAVGAVLGAATGNAGAGAAWGAGTGMMIGGAGAGNYGAASSYTLQRQYDIAYISNPLQDALSRKPRAPALGRVRVYANVRRATVLRQTKLIWRAAFARATPGVP